MAHLETLDLTNFQCQLNAMTKNLFRSTTSFVMAMIFCLFFFNCQGGANNASIARIWDEAILDAIRIDTPRPPVHARNLWHLSVAMYDAWAVYDATASGYLTTEKISSLDDEAAAEARREAISYAAYGVLKDRYALSANAATSLAAFDDLMAELGYDTAVTTTEGDSPAAVGNRVAAAVLAFGDDDGSNQSGNYADPTYTRVNEPLIVDFPGNATMTDPNHWQPLSLLVSFTQNGLPQASGTQSFIGAGWDDVTPFALTRDNADEPYIDPGTPPQLGDPDTDTEFKDQVLDVIEKSATLSPDLDTEIDISPASYGNNSLGANDGAGYTQNPVTHHAYESQIVKLGDFARVLAEYWADGPNSETPPGHWNVIANDASDHHLATHQFEGSGPELDRLEWDVKLYFALNGALHDAAINCWGLKRVYNSSRPISVIRYMAEHGQSSDSSAASYDPEGLPLEDGVVELITDATWPNGKHAGIQCCVNDSGDEAPCTDSNGTPGTQVSCVGEVAVHTWPGQPSDRDSQYSGVRWIRAKEWVPYQLDTFVTPAFPGYNSGHSTFSRSAAEVLAAFTGSDYFPGGLGEHIANKNSTLTFERGPSEEITLQWATYSDAADQAGQSRIYGGIHFLADDFTGRIAGSQIGQSAFAKAKTYFEGHPE